MDRLKEELRKLPDPQAERFRQTLRRDLVAAMQPAPVRRLQAALAATTATAALLAVALVSFVISPDLPRRLHTSWIGADAGNTGSPLPATPAVPTVDDAARQEILQQFLQRARADAGEDQAFLETWYSQQARPARIKAVQQERILAIRQFELASGERVAVLTDLGPAATPGQAGIVPARAPGRTY